MMKKLHQLLKNSKGQTMVEYILIGIGLVAIVIAVFAAGGPLQVALQAGMNRLSALLTAAGG